MAFRFPGDLCDECAFWSALRDGRDLVSRIPPERWATSELQHDKRSEPGRSITFSAGVLSRIDEFDAGFFGISPREAAWLDPQQRLLLELAWEAMENAGLPPSSVAGSDCAVYVGISSLDYGMRGLDDLASMTSHSMTGNSLSIAANRLSYVFDLRGPSLAVDSACSSSLVAFHHACNSLRNGEASVALVGGVNLLLHPYPFVGFTKASMLSADGRCRAFDVAGNGYVRSEGGAVLLLKPLEKALADGDDVQAIVLGSGVNADGAQKTGITIPSREGQAKLMRKVLAQSGLSARDVDFIETHGTGTAVGDPIEAAAIGMVYGLERDGPLPIGSVKANLGHLEPASGMAGLVKAVLALKNRALPPALHLHTPNPQIDFASLNLELVPEYKALTKEEGKPLVAGVNSFGFGGSNAHVLLQEFSPTVSRVFTPEAVIPAPPLFLSARSDAALRAMAGRYADILRNTSAANYYGIAHAAAHCRERLEKRLALQHDSSESAADLLRQYAEGGSPARVFIEDGLPQESGVAFVYSGNGAQWVGMGRALLAESRRFAAILAEVDAAMQPVAGFPLVDELQAAEPDARLDDTIVAQPLLFAIQVAITILLRDFGIEPVAVAGHSVGEIAAAWASGRLDLEQAIRVVCARSQAQALTRGTGRMAAVGLSVSAIEELMAESGNELVVEIAGINSPDNVTISGDLESLMRIQTLVESRGIFFRLLDLDYAFHSRRMDPIKGEFAERLAGFAPVRTGSAIFVSTVTGDVLGDTDLDTSYWWRNVREPVRFADAIARLVDLGCRVFMEIGPHAVLQRYIGECLAAANVKGRVIPTLRQGNDGAQRIVEAALRAHLLVDKPNPQAYFPFPAQRVRLPNYPWQRERHWQSSTSEGLLSIERRRVHPLLGWRLSDTVWENTLDPVVLPWLADHKVGGAIVYPGAAYAEMALAAAREWRGGEHFVVEQLDIVFPMVFDGKHGRTLRLFIDSCDGRVQIKSRQRLSNDEWTLHATGRLLEPASRIPVSRIDSPVAPTKRFERETHYRRASMLGLDYGPTFQGLREARIEKDRLEASLELPESIRLDDYLLHPALLDACFQSLADFFGEETETMRGVALLPVKVGRFELYDMGKATCLRACLRRRSARSVLADFELLDDENRLVASVTGCRFRATHLDRHDQSKLPNWRIVPWLRPHPVESMTTVLPAFSDLAAQMRTRLAGIAAERRIWFKETLPLTEALALSFAYEACRQLAHRFPSDWQTCLDTPYGRWLTDLLNHEGLLRKDADEWTIVTDADLPSAEDIWQALLRDFPACLPHLMSIGRAGRRLPALLSGELDGPELLDGLCKSPIAETLYNDDPAYLGLRLAVEGLLLHLATDWPLSRRLRVLEIASGPSEMPKTLIDSLPEDRFDYVLALPDEAMRTRQQTEYRDHVNIVVTAFDASGWELATDQRLPDVFDVVLLRHTLHRANNPQAALAQTRRWLSAGGLLLLAERHPDWSVNFLEGIDPAWWRKNEKDSCTSISSLLPPETWHRALIDEGFVDCDVFSEPAAEGLAEGAYLLFAKRPVESVAALPAPEQASWLLLADEASRPLADCLQARLESLGQKVAVSDRLEPEPPGACGHVVHMRGWHDTADMASRTMVRLLEDVQALAVRSGNPARLWFVTRGGVLTTGLAVGLEPNPAQFALWGFGRVVMNEYPQLSCTLIDLSCDPSSPDTLVRLENELLRPDEASEIVLSPEARHCLVMREEKERRTRPAQADSRFRLDFHVPGQLRNLVWLPEVERPLCDDEIEVCTRAVGLNFRDVMYLMGLLPDEAVENGFAGAGLGLEFSGVVSRVGTRVKDLSPGDAVMGFGAACFASHVVTRVDAVAPMPERWTFESAATVPTVFFTVYYALKYLADLQPGERVLIHGAAGGVGIAAIQIAHHLGAEIYATAGSDEKRDFVKLLGTDRVFDSRSLAFADEILDATMGEGVDVVLNSLAGEAMRRSLDVLKSFGRFLELGKRDFFENTPVGLRPFKNNVSYFGIDTDQLLTGRPKLAERLFREVMALLREETLAPLPYRTFSVDRIVEAFRVMQQARHIGKIVVSVTDGRPDIEQTVQPPAAIQFKKENTWLVTGGLSGFGLESARWLAARGVGHLVLVGRRGMDTPEAKEILKSFAARNVQALALACDFTDAKAVGRLIEHVKKTLPPLAGVLHAAAVFDDRLIANLDARSIEDVLNAKLLGAWHLHQATMGMPLEHFVLYSSIVTAIGNPGQANYVAANAGLEGLTAMRRSMGLPVTCIAWGPISDAGYLARNEAVKNSLEQHFGKSPVSAAKALAQLDRAFAEETGIVALADFDWGKLARLLPSAASARFDILNRDRKEHAQAGDSLDIRALIAGKTPEEVAGIVRDLVVREVAQILCIGADRIEPNRSLHDLGMDSLMAVELALSLEQRFGIQLPVMMLNDSPTADNVTARIIEKLNGEEDAGEEGPSADLAAEVIRQHGGELTPEEMQSLSDEVHRLAETGTRLIA
jgi:acyl transferase domain-containing protein/NADPH:quinone reductase-like Zn-dependent oxidoreductase/NADP-dependent 3-hydroxy acid dehydrogenase YdfG/acyl carrier protein